MESNVGITHVIGQQEDTGYIIAITVLTGDNKTRSDRIRLSSLCYFFYRYSLYTSIFLC